LATGRNTVAVLGIAKPGGRMPTMMIGLPFPILFGAGAVDRVWTIQRVLV
jgi:hypothetical protein